MKIKSKMMRNPGYSMNSDRNNDKACVGIGGTMKVDLKFRVFHKKSTKFWKKFEEIDAKSRKIHAKKLKTTSEPYKTAEKSRKQLKIDKTLNYSMDLQE